MMRKGCLLLMLSLAGLGCLSPGTHVAKESQKEPPVQRAAAPPPPPAVTADQVNESNVVDVIQAMNREMDFDANNRTAAPATPAMETTMANTSKP